jgi:hypothetical protein
MAESGAIGGRTDISSSRYAHKFNPKCFMPCLTNGMDAFGNTETPAYLYRRSGMGELSSLHTFGAPVDGWE